MPSPFPGMNPYLEHPSVWHDFHGVLVTEMRLELAGQLGSRYQVRMDEHVYIHELDASARRLIGRPDVLISERPGTPLPTGTTAVLAVAPAAGELPIGVDVLQERYIEIRDKQQGRLVTVIELLSPTNKQPGSDREQYLAKRRQYLLSDVNLVEIDLLRGGTRMPVSNLATCAYCVVVSPGDERPNAGLWPIGLRDPLPTIPIPLGRGDTPARLDLQALLHRVYDRGRYADSITEAAPEPSLTFEDAAWAQAVLAAS